jgi:cephalosporin hydroxylase
MDTKMQLIITKKCNMKENDGLSSVNNYAAQQHHNAFLCFYNLIEKIRPARILEIGTALGGLTKFLESCCIFHGLETKILSYDIHKNSWYDDLCSEQLEIIVKNIFSPDYSTLIDSEVIQFIQSVGITIVLCDGGNKKNEFNILSSFLKTNDIIMAHDYATNFDIFESKIKNNIWNWHEIQYSDIEESIKKYNLEPFDQEIMLDVVWGSFRKKC